MTVKSGLDCSSKCSNHHHIAAEASINQLPTNLRGVFVAFFLIYGKGLRYLHHMFFLDILLDTVLMSDPKYDYCTNMK